MKHEHSNYTLFVERVKDAKKRHLKVNWGELIGDCHLPKSKNFRKKEILALCDDRDTAVIAQQLREMVQSSQKIYNSAREHVYVISKREQVKDTLFDDVDFAPQHSEQLPPAPDIKAISRDLANIGRMFIELSFKMQSIR